jgi:hypothetical protein
VEDAGLVVDGVAFHAVEDVVDMAVAGLRQQVDGNGAAPA